MVARSTEYFIFASLFMFSGPIITMVGTSHEPWILMPLGILINASGVYFIYRGAQTEKSEKRAATAEAKASADRSPRE